MEPGPRCHNNRAFDLSPWSWQDVRWINGTVDAAGRFDLSQISDADSYNQLMIIDKDGTLLETGVPDCAACFHRALSSTHMTCPTSESVDSIL
eukprot:3118496-Amphidinium_carterae.1